MIINAVLAHPTQVKILKKVRRQFLNKQAPNETEYRNVDPAARYLTNTEGYPIKASIGLVEVGRKVYIGPEYLNLSFSVSNTIIESHFESKAVTINLLPHENSAIVPWEYTAKRLESYGDLELATWSHMVKNHYSSYEEVMSGYFNLLGSKDPEVHASLRKVKLKTVFARKEIESKYIYNRYIQFLRRDANQPLSCCYSERFLKEIGHTTESFVFWSKDNGIPKIFEADSELYGNVIKGFLKSIPMICDPVQEGPECESVIYDKDGNQLRLMTKFINIVEPSPEGVFIYCYLIICDDQSKENSGLQDKSHKSCKQKKEAEEDGKKIVESEEARC